MSTPLDDDERELLLSKYIDGELPPDQMREVAKKVRDDSDWSGEYEELKAADTSAGRVIERYHQDAPIARDVVRRIHGHGSRRKSARRSRHTIRRPVRSGGSWFFRLTAAAAIIVGAVFGWKYYTAGQTSQQTGSGGDAPLATSTLPRSSAPTVAPLPLSNELAFSTLADGTQVWMRKGSHLETTGARAVKFEGEAYFHIAAASTPFTIITPDGHETQALGTRFDVKTGVDGEHVRVVEGHVRVNVSFVPSNNKGGAISIIDAFGGTEILPDLHTRPADPRAVASEWSKFAPAVSAPSIAEGMISSWSQAGGAPSHSGMTPLPGPAALVAHNDVFYALPDANTAIESGVVIAGGGTPRAYTIVRNRSDSQKQSSLMRLDLNGAQRGTWKTCATFADDSDCAPVVTPHGFVIFACADGSVKAFNPADDKLAWTTPLNAEVCALAAGNDEAVVCSTKAGLVALKGRDGQTLWRCNAITNVKAPACILPDGGLVAVSEAGVGVQLDSSGHVVRTAQLGHGGLSQAPAASENEDAVWLNSGNTVAKYTPRDGLTKECNTFKANVGVVLGNGVLAINGQIFNDFKQNVSSVENAHGYYDPVIALAQDGRGDVFAAFKNGVLHQRAGKEPELVHIPRGEIVPNGLSLSANMLIVTTTQGVQLFE